MVSFGRVLIVAAMLFASGCGIDTNQPTATTAQAGSAAVATTAGVATTAAVGLVSPGMVGEAAIADNFDGTSGLIPETKPALVVTDPMLGAFRMFCTAGQLVRDDPLVYPGQPGVSHLHQFFGNTGTNANSTYQSLRTTGGTTCGQSSTPFNRSAYWFPAMLDGVGNVVKFDYITLYYKRNAASDPLCSLSSAKHLGQCVDLPNGLKFVFGYNMQTLSVGDGMAFWTCWIDENGTPPPSGATGRYSNLADLAAAGCPVGAHIVVAASGPNCWDGVNLDAADHRSHMSYGTGPWYSPQLFNACPADHPYMIPDMEVLVHFTVDANLATWHLVSDEMVAGARAGSTFHMDYWEGWSPTVKAMWHAGCINLHLSFPMGQRVALSSLPGTTNPPPPSAPAPVPAPTPAPTPTTQVCPDGSVIPLTQACPQPLLASKPGKGVGRKK